MLVNYVQLKKAIHLKKHKIFTKERQSKDTPSLQPRNEYLQQEKESTDLGSSIPTDQPKDNIKFTKNPLLKSILVEKIMSSASIFCGVPLLFLVHFSESSSYHQQESDSEHQVNYSESPLFFVRFYVENSLILLEFLHEINSQKVFDIVVHGILLWASMGLLIPVGILTIRMSSCRDDCHPARHKFFFYIHAVLQVLSVLLVTVGAVLSFRNFENAFNNTHQRIGLALYAAIYMQVLVGFKRPKRGTRFRRMWYFLHWILGTSICLVGILNVYTGLQAYHKRSSRNTTLWTIVFTAQICLMFIFKTNGITS